jgi:hypothetical protein
MPVTNVGKISGQLLKSNLTRTSDLLFDNTQVTATPTLFIGHTNNRIGIKTDSPTRELLVNGDTKITGDSIQTNSMTVGNLTFNGVTSTVTASVGSINLNSSGSHTFNELRTDNLAFTNSGIRSLGGSDIKIYPGPGTGKFIIPTDLKSYGGIHATGDITFDGSVFLGGDGPEDSLTVGADINSNLIPDVTSTYDLGETGKRWGHVHLASMTGLTDVTVDNTISLAGVRVNLGIQNKWYVSTNGADNLAGNHPNFAFGSIKHALNYIQESSGGPHQLHILPGTYIEEFPLEVPENVTVKGSGIRSCIIKPSVPYRFNDAFIMNNASMVSDVTIQDFQYSSTQDRGYAFRFSTNAGIVSKSPYVQNVTVLTHGETMTASDPRGFDSGDAGKGALLDANVLDTASPRASMLFNGVTFITPGVDAVTVKNGSRIEFIDCFTYFANRGLYMQHSLNQYTPSAGSYNPVTGDMTLTVGNHSMRVGESVTIADNSLTFTCAQDNHQTDHTYPRATDPYSGKKVIITATTATEFTCNVGVSSNVTAHLFKSATSNAVSEGTLNEARVIASATIYGNKGVVADGNGCLAYLISHNFAYVGTGKNVENETDIINQENEVVTTNNAKVHFVSQDQDGDFRVGENFIVDLGKGTTSIDVTGLDLTGSTLTVGTPGSTTLISATGIDVPNFRISNNTISTLQNGLTIDSAGTTNINANAQMNQNVTVSGDATIAGSGINFGDAPGDTINFSMDFTDNLLPSTNTSSNLGSANKQWRTANFERAEIDGIQIKDSTLQTTDTNAGIDLRGSGTGSVNLEELKFKTEITSTPSNDVGFGVGSGSLRFTGLQDIQLPKGSTAQRPVAENSVRYNTDVNEFEVQSTGNIPLGGIRDGDLDTKVDLSGNQFTFFSAGSNMGTIDGLGNLTVPRFSSQDKFTIDGNQITVSTPGEEAALVASGGRKVFLDTSQFEMQGSELLVTGTNSDMVFTGTGTKQNRIIHFETTQAYKGHAGDEATRDAQTARQGELWWNTTNSTLEVYTGSQWKSATGLQEITVTEAFAQELNLLYNLILN